MKDFFNNELAKKFEEMIENNEDLYFDSEELIEIVIHYLEMGDIGFAELAMKHAEKLHPNSSDLQLKKLEIFLEQKKYQEAKVIIDNLKEAHQNDIDYIICCAKYYSSLGNPWKSIAYCQKGLELKEEENFLHNFIADEYVNLSQPRKALYHYKKALKEDLKDEYAFENCMILYNNLGENEEAEKFINYYLDNFPYSETGWFEYGQLFYRKKDYKEAIVGFDYLLAINSNSVNAYNSKAQCYEELGDYQKAIETYHELLDLEFTKSTTYYRIGKCYMQINQMLKAKKAFQNSLIEDPQFFLPMMELSYIYEEQGKMAEALHFAKEATSLCEENINYQKRLSLLYIENSMYKESVSCLKKITEIKPNYFFAWYAYIEVMIAIGDTAKAIHEIKRAIKIHDKAEFYYQMSYCYLDLDDEVMAKEMLTIALNKNPKLLEDFKEKFPILENLLKD